MHLKRSCIAARRVSQLAAASCLLMASTAMGETDPPILSMDIQTFSKADTNTPIFDQVVMPTNTGPVGPPGGNAWGYDVSIFNPNFSVTGEINASPTTSPTSAFLNPTLNFANNSAESLWFFISLTMPTAHVFDLPLAWSTSASWTLTGPNPMLSTLEDTPLWSVATDENNVGSLFPHETVMDNENLNISGADSGMLGESVLETMTIDLAFKLSPNAIGGVNGLFSVTAVPAPGVLTMIGIAGVFGTRSRRRR